MSAAEKRGVRRSPQESLAELKKLAQESGFELVGDKWLGTDNKHRFRNIKSGREREWKPDQIFQDGFPKELRTPQDRFEELQQLAQDNGYELLETQWKGATEKHRFRHIESGAERELVPHRLVHQGFPKDILSFRNKLDQDKLEQLRQLAQDNEFELLETQWLGTHTKHRFRHIESGKSYAGSPTHIFNRGGFPKDLRTDQERSAESFLKLRQLASDNGYELLETQWKGSFKKHRFHHIESGKSYEGQPNNLFNQGFPKDLRTDQDMFEQLRELAQDNGFELLETEWLGALNKHQFKHTESGNLYEGKPGKLFHQGFPNDILSFRNKLDQDKFEQLRQLAKGSGFKLLEPRWLGTHTNHRFLHIKSGNGREWTPKQLFARGFPEDLRTDQDKLEQLRQLAQDNGFELLETQWLGSKAKHRFLHIESGKEREWVPNNLFSQGFPLADGQRFVTQEVIRQVFSHIFGGEFNTNHDRLKDKNDGKRLELDGYEHFQDAPEMLKRLTGHHNEDQKMAFNQSVAFEFQGDEAHRKKDRTIELDRLKAKLCKEEGIHLMQIDPDLENESRFYRSVRDSEFIYAYVCKAIAAHFGRDIEFPPGFMIDLSNWNPDKESFKRLQELAEDNGFELLESEWLGAMTKHRFRHVKSGKSYEGQPSQLFYRGFPKELRTPQDRFEQLRQLAQDNGFELLEAEWLGSQVKHRFRHIASGKEYEGKPSSDGFPRDLYSFRNISEQEKCEQLRQLAQDNGFELLETRWLGSVVEHRFRHIASGKEREWKPNQLFSRGFPKELRTDQDRFEELKQLAEDNGFELLETQWKGSAVKHRFRHIESGKEYEGMPVFIRSATHAEYPKTHVI